ncbi:MAG: transcription antitermination factor NusB [Bacteriovoracia bacterium]
MQSLTGRRQARQQAFQFLFGHLPLPQNASNPQEKDLYSADQILAFCKSFDFPQNEFTTELIVGTFTHVLELDEKIKSISQHWRLERMPQVDLTILRLAAYEILHCPDVPKSVSINEAIELAKRFGAEESASFVNGLLDKLEKITTITK